MYVSSYLAAYDGPDMNIFPFSLRVNPLNGVVVVVQVLFYLAGLSFNFTTLTVVLDTHLGFGLGFSIPPPISVLASIIFKSIKMRNPIINNR